MTFKTALIYPPVADFTQPHPAIPYLSGFLKEKGEAVIIKDINLEANHALLTTDFLYSCQQIIKSKFDQLERKSFLHLMDHQAYISRLNALGVDSSVISDIDQIKEAFQNKKKFYDYSTYFKAVEQLKQAFHIISAAYYPMKLEACEYTSPYFLTSHSDIVEQCQVEINPFAGFYQSQLVAWIKQEKPNLIGISVVYPTQILQMFAICHFIRVHFPDIHICAGGPFICRMILNMPKEKFHTIFQYLDSIVLYEGESALFNLIQYLKNDTEVHTMNNIILHDRKTNQVHYLSDTPVIENLDQIPPPDYDGFPLEQYFSPELALPYAPTRGCYWNRCAFCHYGATKNGTMKYRERQVEKIISDMDQLSEKYHTYHFSFSVDVIAPKTLLKIANALIQKNRQYTWHTDIKVDPAFTKENCQLIRNAGCQSVAIGLESASPRVLKLMDKGFQPQQAQNCIHNFSGAGIGTQVMTFFNFPTETSDEALETLSFIHDNETEISLFTMGDFSLMEGARIFKNPEKYGIRRIYYPTNDEFNLLVRFEEISTLKSERDRMDLESIYSNLAFRYAPQDFPFVGAVSNNHTFLYFKRFGKDIFKEISGIFHAKNNESDMAKEFRRDSVPVIGPGIRLISTNYSIAELEEVIDENSHDLDEILQNKQQMDRLNQSVKTYPMKSYYLSMEPLNWMELPDMAKTLLGLCNGKNTVEEIASKISPDSWQSIFNILNSLLTYNILISLNE